MCLTVSCPADDRPTALIWAGLALTLCLSQLIVYVLADPPLHEYAYPNLTVLLQPVVDQAVWRAVLLALWLVAGFALLRWAGRSSEHPGES